MADSTTNIAQITARQAQKEVTANNNFDAASPSMIYGRRAEACVGLTWAYYGGRYGGTSIANGTLALEANSDNYMVVHRTTGAVSLTGNSPDEWTDTTNYARAYKIVAGAIAVTSYEDHRAGTNGTQAAGGSGGAGTVTSVDASGGLQTVSGSAITVTGTIRGAQRINAQTGTSYAVAATDRGKHVTLSNAASIAASIAQAGTTGFEDGYYAVLENIGVGAVTITPTTSTINGAATAVLVSGMSGLLFSDGTNYRMIPLDASGVAVNPQTGTTYTYLSGDRNKLVTHSNASSIAGTLPQATGAFGASWSMHVQNRGAGTLTITPTTSTIDGAATLVLTTGQGALIASDGTNYYTVRGGTASGTTTAGRHAIWVSAAAISPSVTGGCASLVAIASAANQPDIVTLDHDATTQEHHQFSIVMPKSWNEGTVTAVPVWSHAATATNFGVVWGLQGVAVSNDDPIAVAYGTVQLSGDTGGTTNDWYAGPETGAITIAGTPQAEDVVFFRGYRDVAHASDTMAIDARLHGWILYMVTDAENDA